MKIEIEIEETILRPLMLILERNSLVDRETSKKMIDGQYDKEVAAAELDLAQAARIRWDIEKDKVKLSDFMKECEKLKSDCEKIKKKVDGNAENGII